MQLREQLLHETALAIRAHAAWRAAATVDVDDRYLLLSYVIWPTPELDRASADRARDELLSLRGQGTRWNGN